MAKTKKKATPDPARVEAEKKTVRGDITREVEQLFEDGLLVELSIGAWTGLTKNTREDLGISQDESLPDYVIGLGMKRMCPHALAKTWMYHANKARHILYSFSFTRFPLSGGAFVPAKALPLLCERLDAQRDAFEKAWREGLVANFDKVREDFLKSQRPEHRERLAQIFPARARVEEKFYFTYSAYTVSLPKRIQGLKAQAEEAAMNRFRTDLDRRVEEFLSESVKTLRTKAASICSTIIDNVRSGKTVSKTNIESLTTFIEQFKTLNYVGDKETESRLTKLQHDILDGIDLDDLKAKGGDAGVRKALADALDGIKEAAEQVTDISSVTGGYRRRIVL